MLPRLVLCNCKAFTSVRAAWREALLNRRRFSSELGKMSTTRAEARHVEGSPDAPVAEVAKPKKRAAQRKVQPAAVGAVSVGLEGGNAESPATEAQKPKKRAARQKAQPDAADGAGAASPEAEAKPKAKRAKASPLPKEPVGVRYEETMRPKRLEASGQTFVSWNVAGKPCLAACAPLIGFCLCLVLNTLLRARVHATRPACVTLKPRRKVPRSAGLRGLIKKDPQALQKLVELEKVDVLCLQETKLQSKNVDEVATLIELPGWSMHWNCSSGKLGYAGVAIFIREAAFDAPPVVRLGIGAEEHDAEGRVLTAELPNLHLVNVYVPNSGASPPPAGSVIRRARHPGRAGGNGGCRCGSETARLQDLAVGQGTGGVRREAAREQADGDHGGLQLRTGGD